MQPVINVQHIVYAAVDKEEEEPLNIREDSDEMNDPDDDESYKSCNEDQQNAQ